MNTWSAKTIILVTQKNYLDRLQLVYPHEEGERRIPESKIKEIKVSYDGHDNEALLNGLLSMPKFPYKDSYVAFLRKDRTAITRNPKTVERICGRLYAMGIDKVIEGIKQGKEANQRRGNSFTAYSRKLFPVVDIAKFQSSKTGIVILGENELIGRDFCNRELNLGVSKRPDFIGKVDKHYVVGEAKFLSSLGGNQDRAFDDGIKLSNNTTGRAHTIFILDGVHWIETTSDQHLRIYHGNSPIFSALLLSKYLESLQH